MFIFQQGTSALLTTVCGSLKLGFWRYLLAVQQGYRVDPWNTRSHYAFIFRNI